MHVKYVEKKLAYSRELRVLLGSPRQELSETVYMSLIEIPLFSRIKLLREVKYEICFITNDNIRYWLVYD